MAKKKSNKLFTLIVLSIVLCAGIFIGGLIFSMDLREEVFGYAEDLPPIKYVLKILPDRYAFDMPAVPVLRLRRHQDR